jgi:hypothetical protein
MMQRYKSNTAANKGFSAMLAKEYIINYINFTQPRFGLKNHTRLTDVSRTGNISTTEVLAVGGHCKATCRK